jgi:plasmid stabilization system protein ParE
MIYRVTIRQRAWRDFRKIKSWLAKRSESGALKWSSACLEALAQLPHDPDRCPVILDLRPENILLRHLLFKTRKGHTYRILFMILQDEVHVLRIRGAGQRTVRRRDLKD